MIQICINTNSFEKGLIPKIDSTLDIGSDCNKWKNLFLSANATVPCLLTSTIKGINNGSIAISNDVCLTGNLVVTGSLDVQTAATNKGAYVGIISGDYNVGSAKTLKFVGTGNTFADNGDGSVSISISGGGGGIGEAVNDTDSLFTYIERYKTVTESITLDTTNCGTTTSIVVTTNPIITVADSKTVTVGAAKTLVVDILNIDSLFDA